MTNKRERFQKFVDIMIVMAWCLVSLIDLGLIWGGEKIRITTLLAQVLITLITGGIIERRWHIVERHLTLLFLILALLYFLAPISPVMAASCADLPQVPLVGFDGDFDALRGGYCQDGLYVPGLVSSTSYWSAPPQHFTTRVLYQADGLLEATAAYHRLTDDGVDGFIALVAPISVGWKIYGRFPGGDYIPLRVADTVARQDAVYHILYTHSAVELSYVLADRLGVIDHVNPDGTRFPVMEFCITDAHPEAVCASDPVDYEDWFRSILNYVED